LENADDGEIYLDNKDTQVIIEAAKNEEKNATKPSSEIGENFDFKI
jgi:hypothetical protein